MGIAEALIAILASAPQLINEATVLYSAIKHGLSAEDQATIDAALAAAKLSDLAATARADDALEAAAKR